MNRRGAVEFATTDTERDLPGLADRMAPKKEALYRYLTETPGALQSRAVRGMVAQADKYGRRLRPWHQSLTPNGPVLKARVRQAQQEVLVDWGNVPQLRKRPLEERIDSMVKRIIASPPDFRDRLIKDAVGEYWKEGMPVTADALRAVATKFLNRADNRVTRTKSTGR